MSMPPEILGLDDQERVLKLALTVFDDKRARYETELADAMESTPLRVSTAADTLVWSLMSNWVRALVRLHGTDGARAAIEAELAFIVAMRADLRQVSAANLFDALGAPSESELGDGGES